MYAASVEKEATGSQVVILAVFAILRTSGPAGGWVAVGGSVAAGGWVAGGGCEGAPPQAARITETTNSRQRTKGFLFMHSPLSANRFPISYHAGFAENLQIINDYNPLP
jgi:hypothetical protein